MKHEEYLMMSKKTLSEGFFIETQHQKNMLHAAIGICTEAGEMLPMAKQILEGDQIDIVNLKEELGDMEWYIAIFYREMKGMEMGDVMAAKLEWDDLYKTFIGMTVISTEILDLLKKNAYYNKTVDEKVFTGLLGNLESMIGTLVYSLDLDLSEIRQTNIDKLRARYGEKFSEKKAVERDLEQERKVLEAGGLPQDHKYDPGRKMVRATPVARPHPDVPTVVGEIITGEELVGIDFSTFGVTTDSPIKNGQMVYFRQVKCFVDQFDPETKIATMRLMNNMADVYLTSLSEENQKEEEE